MTLKCNKEETSKSTTIGHRGHMMNNKGTLAKIMFVFRNKNMP
jgi:hypothetical protein